MAFLSRLDTSATARGRRFQIGRELTRTYSGKIAFGGWYYTARFPDLVDTLSSGAPVQRHGSAGAYVIADETIWAAQNGHSGPLTAFVQLGLGDWRVNQVGSYIGAGLTFVAPFRNGPHDQLGLAIAAARNGSHFTRAQSMMGVVASGETAIELTSRGAWSVDHRAARPTIRDQPGRNEGDAECTGAGPAHRLVALKSR